jgi:mono/diheme cytochrome c family protein
MNTRRLVTAVFALLLAGSAFGCSKKTEATDTSPAAAKIDTAAAKEMFNTRCSACHGTSGRGDGPASAALTPKPRNYTDVAWQKSVTDEQIKKTIVYGGAAVGKSPIMPGSPDLDAKPEVVEGLLQIVRGFGN